MIRVLVAEDQHLIRGALVALLSLEPDIEVVAETSRGDTVLSEIDRCGPDVAVLDIHMPGMDGITAAQQLRQAGSPVRVLVLTSVDTPGTHDRARQAGVAGFLVKDAPCDELSRAVREAYAGRRTYSPEFAAAAVGTVASGPLSAREREILGAIHGGASPKQVRRAFGLSEAMVHAHLAAAQGKTGGANSADAARIAHHNGWI